MASKLMEGMSWLRRSLDQPHPTVSPTKSAPAQPIRQKSEGDQEGGEEDDNKAVRSLSSALDGLDLGSTDMDKQSAVLSLTEADRLAPHLPSRVVGAPWKLTFSTEVDGFSLKSLYRRANVAVPEGQSAPSLLVVRATDGSRFGAVVPDAFRIQEREKFYGSGETFVFRLSTPGDEADFRVWPFAHTNFYVIFCSSDVLSVGSGDGHPAVQIDGDLNVGRSDECPTYGNSEPLTPQRDFVVQTLEVWNFGP